MGVTDVAFSGRVRVVLTGLMDTIPVVSAAQVSLVELPRFRCCSSSHAYCPSSDIRRPSLTLPEFYNVMKRGDMECTLSVNITAAQGPTSASSGLGR